MNPRLLVVSFASRWLETWKISMRAGFPQPFTPRDVLYAFDGAGNELWKISSGPASNLFVPHALAVTASGRIFATGELWRRAERTVGAPFGFVFLPERTGFRQYTQTGDLMQETYQADRTAFWSAIAVTPSGKIVVAGTPDTAGNTLHQYHDDGTVEWATNTGQVENPFGYWLDGVFYGSVPSFELNLDHAFGLVAVDSGHNVIVTATTNTFPRSAVLKYDSAGVLQWSFPLYNVSGGLALDGDDNIYVGCAGTTHPDYPDETLHTLKLAPNGTLLAATASVVTWDGNPYTVFDRLSVDANGLHVCAINGNIGYLRYDLDLVEQDAATLITTNKRVAVAFDADGGYYRLFNNVGSGAGTVENTVRRRASVAATTDLWEAPPTSSDAIPRTIIVRDVQMPGLRLPLRPGPVALWDHVAWQGDRYAIAPGLPLPMALGAPRWLLEPMVAGAAQTLYRLRIDGDPILYLQPSFFSIRRGTTEAATLNVTCPNPSAAALAVLNGREGAVMRLQTGFRQGDHPVQFVDHLVVTLATARIDAGPQSSAVSLTGRAAEVIASSRRRRVYGLSYRRSTAAGAQTWRVIPDAYLEPGDTALYGSEELTVAQITVSVSTTQATMELSEVADG
jgi:hypothetical protein